MFKFSNDLDLESFLNIHLLKILIIIIKIVVYYYFFLGWIIFLNYLEISFTSLLLCYSVFIKKFIYTLL